MMPKSRTTVIDLDHDRLTYVSGTVSQGRVVVERVGSAVRPAGVDVGDARALGEWVGERLREAGIGGGSAGRVVLCVPRGNVVMKRLSFPGLASADDPDLVEMVRLSMTRQLPMKVEGTSIDFIPLGSGRVAGAAPTEEGGEEGAGVEVLACAFPGDRVAWCRGVAQAAGLRLGALTLRASGAATLVSQHGDAASGPVLGVSLGWSSVEFLVVHEGEIVFVRSADVPLGESVSPEQYAQRVAVEAKRTWMAYRVSPGSMDVGSAVVLGTGEVASAVAVACGGALDKASATVGTPTFVTREDAGGEGSEGGEGEMLSAASVALVGVLVAGASKRAIFDFASPRKPPDRSAGLRRGVLLGVLGLIVVVGGAVVLAQNEVARVRHQAGLARERAVELGGRVTEFRRADMRLRHLEGWMSAEVDWLSHWSRVNEAFPSPPAALLDSLSGQITRANVLFEAGGSSGSRTYSGAQWGTEVQLVLHATGRLSSRAVGNAFRERLVEDPTYVVESRGSDTEDRFDLNLVSRVVAPGAGAGASAERGGAR